MEDIIDIIVTETTNLIEITSQPTDEIIDVNIIDNREDVTLNVTPTVVEININSLTGNFGVNWGEIEGTLSNQTDLQNALNLKADLVGGKVPSSQLPSYVDDVVEVANYASLPVTGETGKIYVTIDTNYIYRWTGSVYVEIKDSSAVWGAITGTLSNQTDLQNALNAKLNLTGGTLSGALTLGSPFGDNQTLLNLPATNKLIYREGTGNLYGFNIESGYDNSLFLTNSEGPYNQTIYFGDSTGAGNIFGVSTSNDTGSTWSSRLVINQNGNIGLNKNNPSEILDVAGNGLFSGNVTANSFIKSGGTSSQFLKANGSVDSSTYATTSQLHNPVTIGTANGLSLSTQVLSLGLASSSANGALSSTDWTTFNNKQNALSGTGFVKISGTTISYDNSTYLTTSAAASTYLDLAGGTLTGALNGTSATFSSTVTIVNQSLKLSNNWNITARNAANTLDLALIGRNASNRVVIDVDGYGTNIGGGGTILINPAGGNVGIGTSTPSSKLHIEGTGTGAWMTINRTDTGSNIVDFTQSGTRLGYIGYIGNDLNINNATASNLVFRTSDAERMRITSNGNLGIGTTSPNYKLHVVTTAVAGRQDMTNIDRTAANMIRFTNPQYSALASIGILLRVFPDSDARQGAGIIASGGSINGETDLDLFVSKDLTTSNSYSALSIKGGTGNVGIGTTSPVPTAILHADSTTKGVLFPRMTTTQKNAISSPATGLVIFDTTLGKLCVFSTTWQTVTSV